MNNENNNKLNELKREFRKSNVKKCKRINNTLKEFKKNGIVKLLEHM